MIKKVDYTLITGASSGLGAEFATQLAELEYNLILTARSSEKLNDLKVLLNSKYPKLDIIIISGDLTKNSFRNALWAKLTGHNINIFINNAGFGAYGPVTLLSKPNQLEMIQLNVVAMTDLSIVFAKRLRESRSSGVILHIGSISGNMPCPYTAVYSATKAYISSFSVSLDIELRRHNIRSLLLLPGSTATGFQERAKADLKISRFSQLDCSKVVKHGVNMIRDHKLIGIPGLKGKFYNLLNKVVSRQRAALMVKKHMKKTGKDHADS